MSQSSYEGGVHTPTEQNQDGRRGNGGNAARLMRWWSSVDAGAVHPDSRLEFLSNL